MVLSDLDEARELSGHLDAAMFALSASMRERFAPILTDSLGRTWCKRVSAANGAFAEYDFASYADCLLGSTERTRPHRDIFRSAAGKPWAAYGHLLETAKRARNAVAHPSRPFDRRSTARLLDDFATLAEALELSTAAELRASATAVRAGDYSRAAREATTDPTEVLRLSAELEQAREEKAALAEEVRAASERVAQQDAALAAEKEAREIQSALRRQAEDALTATAHVRAEREFLEAEAERHRQEARGAQHRAEIAVQASRKAQEERNELARQMEASQKRIAGLEQQGRALAEQVAPPESTAHSTPDLDALEERVEVVRRQAQELRQFVARAATGANDIASSPSRVDSTSFTGPAAHDVRPGQPWPYGAGEYSYSLRPTAEDVYEYETSTWLSDLIGKDKARKVFKRLAKNRPEGGTIRVDSDGDVSTQRKSGGGRFYLGRVADHEWFPNVIDFGAPSTEPLEQPAVARASARTPAMTVTGPAAHDVSPGQPWPYGAGEYSYSLRPTAEDVYEYETSIWLSDLIGKDKARQVFKRLAKNRPEGGTIRVDADGDVSTQRKSGGGRFYLGRVADHEWFPNVINFSAPPSGQLQADAPPRTASRALASTVSGPAAHDVSPGQPWPYGAGAHSYSLRPTAEDVYEYETGIWLSDLIGKNKARQVFKRLAKNRLEGGTIRVDADGDVSTQRKSGGGRFYLGRVADHEWFPNVIGG
jgi:hypothetical protein